MISSRRRAALALLVLGAAAWPATAFTEPRQEIADALAPWTAGVSLRPVSKNAERHTIHSYYVCNPESPDGSRVLYYASTTADGHAGDLCVLDRATGRETTLARQLHTEDAHRAACQQWTRGGRSIAYHDVRNGRWLVAVVDLETLEERVLVHDRQLAFGQPAGDWLPVYGCHWKPGDHRDIEWVHAGTGETRVVVKAHDVQQAFEPWLAKEFAGRPISLFFPVVSPDQTRMFFKIAAAGEGDNFRSSSASHRQGLFVYDLRGGQITIMREKWGHPAWHPDSHRIIEMGNILIDSDTGQVDRLPKLPNFRGSHPSVSPDGRLFATDGLADSIGGPAGQWCVAVGDLRGERYAVLHRFDNTHGARSWRSSHPHPAFSADGQRVYFNVSSGPWTQLHVAEVGQP